MFEKTIKRKYQIWYASILLFITIRNFFFVAFISSYNIKAINVCPNNKRMSTIKCIPSRYWKYCVLREKMGFSQYYKIRTRKQYTSQKSSGICQCLVSIYISKENLITS